MINKAKNSLTLIFTLIFFAFLIFYFFANVDAFYRLLEVSVYSILGLTILKTARIFITGLFTKITLDAFQKNISLRETNQLSILSSIGNFFGPILGGASIRAVYLKKKHDFNYSTFVSTLYGFYIIAFLSNSFLGLLALCIFYLSEGSAPGLKAMSLLLSVILLGTLMMILLPVRIPRTILKSFNFLPTKILRVASKTIDGWEVIRRHKSLIVKLFMLNIAVIVIATAETGLIYSMFVTDYTFLSVFLYTIFGSLTILVSFTPGAIGVREALYLFTSSIIMVNGEQIVQMAAIDRSVTFLLLFILFTISKILNVKEKISQEK